MRRLMLQFHYNCKIYDYALADAANLWYNPEFNRNDPVMVLATGWSEKPDRSEAVQAFAQAVQCRGQINLLVIDSGAYVNTLYTWSSYNTEFVGQHVGYALGQLLRVVPIDSLHLIGHGLGAHILGAAARYLKELTNQTIPRITGLDPALPCFNMGDCLTGLLRGDAKFVDIIHSNAGVLGARYPSGDADFYPGGVTSLPPGCLNIFCAHQRSWEYFVETIFPGNEYNFMATPCVSITRLRNGKCRDPQVPMGYMLNSTARGNFFLEVLEDSPYGHESNAAQKLYMSNCGLCRS